MAASCNRSTSDWMDPLQLKKGGPMNVEVENLDQLIKIDPYLKEHEREIRRRYDDPNCS